MVTRSVQSDGTSTMQPKHGFLRRPFGPSKQHFLESASIQMLLFEVNSSIFIARWDECLNNKGYDWTSYHKRTFHCSSWHWFWSINPLNAELNPICHLLALLGAHHILYISRIRVKRKVNFYLTSRDDLRPFVQEITLQQFPSKLWKRFSIASSALTATFVWIL